MKYPIHNASFFEMEEQEVLIPIGQSAPGDKIKEFSYSEREECDTFTNALDLNMERKYTLGGKSTGGKSAPEW